MAVILVTHGVPREGFYPLKEHSVFIPPPCKAYTREELMALLPEADAVVAGGALDAEMIRHAKRLKVIANYGAGFDRVDVKEAAYLGIPVTNIPEVTAESTAELAVGLMLAASRRIAEKNMRLRQEEPSSLFGMGIEMGHNLGGKILGVLGVGHIGSRVAAVGKALGMRVIGYSRHGVDPAVAEGVTLDELLSRADVLTLHCPLTEETRGLMNRERLMRMKRGAILINTSRGAVVDSEALAEAVASGHLAAAGLDVFPDEPQVPECVLALKQIVLTPHIGTNTEEARYAMAEACSLQILDALAGRRPKNVVNGV